VLPPLAAALLLLLRQTMNAKPASPTPAIGAHFGNGLRGRFPCSVAGFAATTHLDSANAEMLSAREEDWHQQGTAS
jgi:hypothetical protein